MKIANIFDNAHLYKIFQLGVIKKGTTKKVRDEVLKPIGVKRVLDFGCGIGYHAEEFRNSTYLGVEPLQGCVDKANKLFKSSSAQFVTGDQHFLKSIPDSSFDLIIALGVLHHIDEDIVSEFLKESYRILKRGGRLTTFDPVFHVNQTRISRWVVSKDRGNWVRTIEEYLRPVEVVYKNNVHYKIYSNLLRIPYDHIHMEMIKE